MPYNVVLVASLCEIRLDKVCDNIMSAFKSRYEHVSQTCVHSVLHI